MPRKNALISSTCTSPGFLPWQVSQGVCMFFNTPFSKFFLFLVVFMAKNKEAISFLHDANARNDLKIGPLRQMFGAEGYGVYWMIIEILREQSNFKIKLCDLDGLDCQLKPHNLDFKKFLSFCFDKELLKKDKKYLWSDSLLRRMKAFTDARKRMSEGGRKGMQSRYKHLISTLQDTNKGVQTNTNESNANTNITQIQNTAKEILEFLNKKTERNFTDTRLIIENLLDGRTFKDHIQIIEVKCQDPYFVSHPDNLNPDTLFGKHFDKYVNQRVEDFKKPKQSQTQRVDSVQETIDYFNKGGGK